MDELDELVVEVRAATGGFTADIGRMRANFDSVLVDGFGRAGDVLERGLLGAIRRGSLGFEDLRRIALGVLGDIAAQAVQGALGSIGGAGGGAATGGGGLLGLGNLLGSALGGVLGLPGRATGGLVTAGRGYLVGERGPELFVPNSSGRVEPNTASTGRDVRVSIQVVAPKGAAAPESLQRSGRQVARIVRKALTEF
ncbi:MAG: tail tape measure protein [Novosphingobium sp.]